MNDISFNRGNESTESFNRRVQLEARNLANGKYWYIVHCKGNCEQIALRNLQNQNFDVFLPLQKRTRRKGGSFQTRLSPLFPGYIFVFLDPGVGQWRKINSTRGVLRLVCSAVDPIPVPTAIMDQLFTRCDQTGVFKHSTNLVAGEDAKISEGPLAGAIGKIIEIDPRKRINLIIDFMGQKSILNVNSTAVRPTS